MIFPFIHLYINRLSFPLLSPSTQSNIDTIRHGLALLLVGEPKVDAERREDEALELDLAEGLEVLVVEVDNLEVRLDPRLGNRLGQDGAASGDCRIVVKRL